MSTKKLSRTILEGGRVRNCRIDERINTKAERAQLRAQLRKIQIDPEADEDENYAIRKKDYREFTDQLSPVWRFLNSKDGMPWSELKRELAHKFDVRSLAGYHIVQQHMMREIKGSGAQEGLYRFRSEEDDLLNYRYYIDDDNIFRVNKDHYSYKGRGPRSYHYFSDAARAVLDDWMGERLIGQVGEKFYWFVQSGTKSRDLNARVPDGWDKIMVYGFGGFRQDKELTKEEIEYFKSYPERVQEGKLKQAPVYKEDEEAA